MADSLRAIRAMVRAEQTVQTELLDEFHETATRSLRLVAAEESTDVAPAWIARAVGLGVGVGLALPAFGCLVLSVAFGAI